VRDPRRRADVALRYRASTNQNLRLRRCVDGGDSTRPVACEHQRRRQGSTDRTGPGFAEALARQHSTSGPRVASGQVSTRSAHGRPPIPLDERR
jgi:hypothetical protein